MALPLCLGIALASGAPLLSGIIAGVIGGILVGLISGSKLGVSGPAAGLAVIVFDAIRELGTNEEGVFNIEIGFRLFLSAVVLAGAIQIVFAALKAGKIGLYFPNPVIKGMLAAIGILIIWKQLPFILGEGTLATIRIFFQKGESYLSILNQVVNTINYSSVFIALLSLFILGVLELPFMKRMKIFRRLQGPLIVVAIGIAISSLAKWTDFFSYLKIEKVSISTATENDKLSALLTFPNWSQVWSLQILLIALTITIIASLETLLSVKATDDMDPERSRTPLNRELMAQGIGNIFSGLIGGLPITQVIARSSVNVQSGGKSKTATIFHGFLILLSVVFIPEILNLIPLASLSAILIVVGYKLTKPQLFRDMKQKGKIPFAVFTITILSILLTDLLVGILIGVLLYLLLNCKNIFKRFNTGKQIDKG